MLVIDAAREANKMRTANLLLGELGQMFRYAAAREVDTGDPTAAITRKDAGGQDKESDRVLDDSEILMLRDILAKPPNRNHDTTSPGGECRPCTRNWRRGGLLQRWRAP